MIKGKHLFLGNLISAAIFLITLFFFHNSLDETQLEILTALIISLSFFCVLSIPMMWMDDL